MADGPERRLSVLARQLGVEDTGQLLSANPCATSSGNAVAPLLAGQVALITGKGIGEAAALLLAAHGAAVVVCDIDGTAAQLVAGAVQTFIEHEAGGRAVAVAGDVTAPDFGERAVGEALRAFGGLHILINNAGYTWDGVAHKMSDEQWSAMLEVHCTAPFRLIRAAAPAMRDAAKAESQGSQVSCIINISSTSGTHGNAGQANYATAKAGVVGLTKAVAKEWGPLNVRCNAIAFGLIDTRLTRPKEQGESIQVGGQTVPLGIPSADAYWKQLKAQVPLRRVGTAEEAAGAILALASPYSSYVTGQVLEVNGGSHM
ncbi:3-oxoacyl-[acyl-carrier-protein] reductase FabG [Tetrabaena socialis]|uniref:3-oxoacyl-[acyl-carrier-protein] reductase FabG n=1 Tax=Tetrabaena socialis TaxID=47790 RepID=A0A2J7ZXX9_9CHLO|nr:3-oxoacyl-[acyl-carrier-protein] reductase FabG [Tetrabaena socialis]|eukprot:PNH05124.1 3-oxoacyl-[acyl-carrier-protein] reductase FabG [Tetrabaena socialis]